MRSNCLFWAIGQCLKHGGHIEFVESGHPLIFRTVWVDKFGRRFHFFPAHPKRGWQALVHKFWFEGRVRRVR